MKIEFKLSSKEAAMVGDIVSTAEQLLRGNKKAAKYTKGVRALTKDIVSGKSRKVTIEIG